MHLDGIEIVWLGHASFLIQGAGSVVYIDPWKLSSTQKADLVLVSHDHFDHCSPDDVAKVAGKDTLIITTQDCAAKFEGSVREERAGAGVEHHGVKVEVVPAYNTDKNFHSQEKGWVGFIITIGGKRIYHAGDTDRIPEMRQLRPVDAALLPVSGIYVMTAEQAAEAARDIPAKVFIPMHYGDIVGSQQDAERFKALCEGLHVEILTKR